MMNYPYTVTLDKEEDIPIISKEQIEQFKEEISTYQKESIKREARGNK